MEENNTPQENDTPRPKWQIWGARVLLVLVIIGVLGYYYWIAYKY